MDVGCVSRSEPQLELASQYVPYLTLAWAAAQLGLCLQECDDFGSA